MRRLGTHLQAAAGRLWRWFFPPAIELPAGLSRLLAFLFPHLDQRTASFHRGFPHLLRLLRNQGITLPGLWPPGRARVYLDPARWDPASLPGLGLVVHEAYHLLQVQQAWRGRGFGLFHPFIVLYVACAAGNRFRYAGHPLETDAYRVAGRPRSLFECHADPAALPAAPLGTSPGPGPGPGSGPGSNNELDFAPLQACCHPAVTADSGLAFWSKLAASTPGWTPLARAAGWLLGAPSAAGGGRLRRAVALPPAALLLALGGLLVAAWLALWSAAAAVLGLAQLLVEGAGAAAAGLLWTLGTLLLVPGHFYSDRPARGPGRIPDSADCADSADSADSADPDGGSR